MALAESRILWRLVRGEPSRTTARERLTEFYAPQAASYDRFRERLLHGRRELFERLALQPGETMVELGAGTGRNLEFLGPSLATLKQVWLVDLCPPLLDVARSRAAGWHNVAMVECDATRFQPPTTVDTVVFSYALTMIPDWFQAVDNALDMLRPWGRIAVTDFYVSRPYPESGLKRHGALTRTLWPLWFGHDGVRLNADHLPYLMCRSQIEYLQEGTGSVPWLPGLRVPYYVFIGRKAA